MPNQRANPRKECKEKLNSIKVTRLKRTESLMKIDDYIKDIEKHIERNMELC